VKRNTALKNIKSTSTESISSSGNFIFDETNDDADLKNRSIKSGTVTLIAQSIKLILQIGAITILARLLTPRDFGLIAMVSAIFAFAQIFGDMGLSAATVQRAEISHAQVSTLFWINVMIGVGLMIASAAISPLLSWFYKEPRVTWIALALSISFLFSGLGIQHRALLTRQMLFGRLAFIEIFSYALGIIIAITLYSHGYWSLVAMSIVTSVSNVFVTWLLCPWRPGPPVKNSDVRPMLTFGGHLTGMGLINYFARNLDNVLIGRFLGPVQLGFYSRAYNLFMMPMTQITYPIANVAMPVLSKLQNDGERFKKYYLSAISIIAFITMPLGVFLFIMADEIVLTFLGKQWVESITIFRYLSISLLFQPIFSSGNWLYVATGRTDLLLKFGSLGTVFIVVSFLIGLPFGPKGVALSYSICIVLWTWPGLYFATRLTPVTSVNVLFSVLPALSGALIGGITSIFAKFYVTANFPIWSTLLIGFVVMFSVYILLVFFLFRQKSFYFSIFQDLWINRKNSIQ